MEDFAEVRIDRREEGGIAIFVKSKKIEAMMKSGLNASAKALLDNTTPGVIKHGTATNVPNPASNYPYVKGESNAAIGVWTGHDLYNSPSVVVDTNKGIVDWNYAKYFIANNGVINAGMFQVKGLSEGVTFVETGLLSNTTLEKARNNFKDILITLYKDYLKNPKLQLKLTMEELV